MYLPWPHAAPPAGMASGVFHASMDKTWHNCRTHTHAANAGPTALTTQAGSVHHAGGYAGSFFSSSLVMQAGADRATAAVAGLPISDLWSCRQVLIKQLQQLQRFALWSCRQVTDKAAAAVVGLLMRFSIPSMMLQHGMAFAAVP